LAIFSVHLFTNYVLMNGGIWAVSYKLTDSNWHLSGWIYKPLGKFEELLREMTCGMYWLVQITKTWHNRRPWPNDLKKRRNHGQFLSKSSPVLATSTAASWYYVHECLMIVFLVGVWSTMMITPSGLQKFQHGNRDSFFQAQSCSIGRVSTLLSKKHLWRYISRKKRTFLASAHAYDSQVLYVSIYLFLHTQVLNATKLEVPSASKFVTLNSNQNKL
jgi:hypothetical protein